MGRRFDPVPLLPPMLGARSDVAHDRTWAPDHSAPSQRRHLLRPTWRLDCHIRWLEEFPLRGSQRVSSGDSGFAATDAPFAASGAAVDTTTFAACARPSRIQANAILAGMAGATSAFAGASTSTVPDPAPSRAASPSAEARRSFRPRATESVSCAALSRRNTRDTAWPTESRMSFLAPASNRQAMWLQKW